MKPKFSMLMLGLLCPQISIVFAQKSPIEWTNNSFNLHFDTTSKDNYAHFNGYDRNLGLSYTFKNTGQHVTFMDTTILYSNEKYITKPNETSTVSFPSKVDYRSLLNKRDTTIYVSLPFYYEGEIYRERLACNLTFGKSKLVKYSTLQIDVTDFVADTVKRKPSLVFTHYFTIKNISQKTIWCTEHFTAYNDAPRLESHNKLVKILPGETYKIPAKMYMDMKYRFKCEGYIHVFSDDTRESYKCTISSSYDRSDNKNEIKQPCGQNGAPISPDLWSPHR